MLIRVGLENSSVEGERSMAWVLDYPGCYAYGKTGPEAMMGVPRALVSYQEWLGRHTASSWLADLGDFDVRLVQTFETYTIDDAFNVLSPGADGYEVGAWFLDDWRPLSEEDVRRALLLLEWSRADLLISVEGLSAAQMAEKLPGQRWPIGGILNHTAGAEWWYMDNLGLSGIERDALPKDPFERLALVRARLRQLLPSLVGSSKVTGEEGELWSARKLLRRALWHERDHTGHIYQLRP